MYKFSFTTVGGSTRVNIHTGEDIRHLAELDQKMWTVLSCPTTGLEIDENSLKCMDTDQDGTLHVKEVIQTAEWICANLVDTNTLLTSTDQIMIDNIANPQLKELATTIAGDNKYIDLTMVNTSIANAQSQVAQQPLPAAPYNAEITAACKEKKDEYTNYFRLTKLQQAGLATIPADTPVPGMTEEAYNDMLNAITAHENEVAAIQKANNDAIAAASAQYEPLKKMILVHRDLYTLLRNFVTLNDFFSNDPKQQAIFQAGTLIIDQRACSLCMIVNDMGKQNAQAGASGMFLVYCNCRNKKLNKTMDIVAAVTVGDIKNITVGKNAIFYDRKGNDWDATVTKIIDNPISISQAFWSPYRKFGQWVTDLINKSALEKDKKAFESMTTTVQQQTAPADAAKKESFDIAKFAGIFAAISMAFGAIGSVLVDLAKGINALEWYKLLAAIVAILLVISGPSMVLAWFKLRKRNLAPILNANGWAINAEAIINVVFSSTLTTQAKFPILQVKKHKKNRKWAIAIAIILLLVIILALAAYYCCQQGCNLCAQ